MKSWFAKRLLSWFAHSGRHDLPWQHPRTPYRVWVSEIMLQQTQVNTVIPYFERFMDHFPTIETLAKAPLDSVLAVWTGLGYYARARNLHLAAQEINKTFSNTFPNTVDTLTQLPGIGPSTAGAIISQAFNMPAVVLDANVKRVLLRFYGISAYPNDPKIHAQLWVLAQKLLPKQQAADYTQSMMDLGATLCTIKNPQCAVCPIHLRCQAFQQGTVATILQPKPKVKRPVKTLQVLYISDTTGNFLLLEKRPAHGIWGGLWSFPELSVEGSLKEWYEENIGALPKKSLCIAQGPVGKHVFTHYTLLYHPLHLKLSRNKTLSHPSLQWHALSALRTLGLSGIVKKLVGKQSSTA